MEIISVSIDWMDRYSNNPHMTIEVDEIPEDLKYYAHKLEDDRTFYIATKRCLVSFMIHDPAKEHGSGGRMTTLRLIDNTDVTFKGPWSSNSTVAYDIGGIECTEVSLRLKGEKYSRHACVTTGFFKEAILWYNEHVGDREARAVLYDDHERHYWELAKMPANVNP